MLGRTSTLITISTLFGPAATGWLDKRCCTNSHSEWIQLYTEHMPTYDLLAKQVCHKLVSILVNCPTIICSPNTGSITWRVTSSETTNPGPSFTIVATISTCFYYLFSCFLYYFRSHTPFNLLFYCSLCY